MHILTEIKQNSSLLFLYFLLWDHANLLGKGLKCFEFKPKKNRMLSSLKLSSLLKMGRGKIRKDLWYKSLTELHMMVEEVVLTPGHHFRNYNLSAYKIYTFYSIYQSSRLFEIMLTDDFFFFLYDSGGWG